MFSVELTPRAAAAISHARAWWLEHREKAPDALDVELDGLVSRLEQRPDLVGRPVARAMGVRRVYLRRIRYYVYFQIVDDARVQVLALWHGSREGDPLG